MGFGFKVFNNIGAYGPPWGVTPTATGAPGLSRDTVARPVVNVISGGVGSRTVSPKPDGPQPGVLYRWLSDNQALREFGYLLTAIPVRRFFAKVRAADSMPAMQPSEVKDMLKLLKPGDVIQSGNNGSFVHAMFYLGDDQIVHSLAQGGFGRKMIGVRAERLTDYFSRGERDTVVVLRPQWEPGQFEKAVSYANAQVGKHYDTLFLANSDDRHYCTELVAQILSRAGVARVPSHLEGKLKWRLIRNEDLRRSPDLSVVYRRNHD